MEIKCNLVQREDDENVINQIPWLKQLDTRITVNAQT